VVFRVGGLIRLFSDIDVDDPYLTVAGQSAPGGGITIRSDPSNGEEAIRIEAHDVVIRHIRIRSGATSSPTCCAGPITLLHGPHDLIIDHSSFSWGVDENMSASDGPHDYTIQWSVVSEALLDSSHEEGPHSKGVLIGDYTDEYPASSHRRLSLHHNIFAHNFDRNPELQNAGENDIVNNVIYNYGEAVIRGKDRSGVVQRTNVIGNFIVAGEDSIKSVYEVDLNKDSSSSPGFELYVRGNIGPHRPNGGLPEEYVVDPDSRDWIVPSPSFKSAPITITSASRAYADVLAWAGARVPERDPVDQRVILSVIRRTGHIIDDPSEVGGWPEVKPGIPYPDRDRDGMGDLWELIRGLDPDDPRDGDDVAPNGYTWVENFLNQLAGDLTEGDSFQPRAAVEVGSGPEPWLCCSSTVSPARRPWRLAF
jgi:hypothetical protein